MNTEKMPLLKDCRIDYKTFNGTTYSCLVNCVTNSIYYYKCGVCSLKYIYSEFKFSVKSSLTIDNYPFSFLSEYLIKVANGIYQY